MVNITKYLKGSVPHFERVLIDAQNALSSQEVPEEVRLELAETVVFVNNILKEIAELPAQETNGEQNV
jgi:hypothetical protein